MQSDGAVTTQSVPQDVVFGGDPTFLVPYAATLDGLEDHGFAYSTSGYGFGHHAHLLIGFLSLRCWASLASIAWCAAHSELNVNSGLVSADGAVRAG